LSGVPAAEFEIPIYYYRECDTVIVTSLLALRFSAETRLGAVRLDTDALVKASTVVPRLVGAKSDTLHSRFANMPSTPCTQQDLSTY